MDEGSNMSLTFSVQGTETRAGNGSVPAKLDIKDVWSAVVKTLMVTHDMIDGVQQRSNRRWDVTLHPQAHQVYNRIKMTYMHMDKEIKTRTGRVVKITDPLEVVTEVTVRKVPMYWSQQRVYSIFSKYGVVKSIKKERYRSADAEGTSFAGLWNGNLRIQMIVKNRIPSGITLSDITIEIFHKNQEPTCRKCGYSGHTFYECTTPMPERMNVFDMDDFPLLPTRQSPNTRQTTDTDEENEGTQNRQPAQNVVTADTEEETQNRQPSNNVGITDTDEESEETQNASDSDQDSDSDSESFSSASALDSMLQIESVENDITNSHTETSINPSATNPIIHTNENIVNPPNQTTPYENISKLLRDSRSTSTPLLESTHTVPLNSPETPIVNTAIHNLANNSDAAPEKLNGKHTEQEDTLSNNHHKHRTLSERRPRESSTTSAEDGTVSAVVSKNDAIEDQDEAEPFSQVFVNKTKERILKKKHKRNEDMAKQAFWV